MSLKSEVQLVQLPRAAVQAPVQPREAVGAQQWPPKQAALSQPVEEVQVRPGLRSLGHDMGL